MCFGNYIILMGKILLCFSIISMLSINEIVHIHSSCLMLMFGWNCLLMKLLVLIGISKLFESEILIDVGRVFLFEFSLYSWCCFWSWSFLLVLVDVRHQLFLGLVNWVILLQLRICFSQRWSQTSSFAIHIYLTIFFQNIRLLLIVLISRCWTLSCSRYLSHIWKLFMTLHLTIVSEVVIISILLLSRLSFIVVPLLLLWLCLLRNISSLLMTLLTRNSSSITIIISLKVILILMYGWSISKIHYSSIWKDLNSIIYKIHSSLLPLKLWWWLHSLLLLII